MIRVAVADDNAVLRLGISAHLGLCDDLEVVGEAADGHQALALVERLRPDVLILDVRMPGLDGLEVLDRLDLGGDGLRVLVLTNTDDATTVHGALTRGAAGYLVHPQHDLGDLEHAVRQVARGETPLGSRAVATLLTLLPASAGGDDGGDGPGPDLEARARRFHLSAREVEVLELLATGAANHEIGTTLYIAEKTVKNHLNRIYPKLGAGSRASAMAIWRGDREPEPPRPARRPAGPAPPRSRFDQRGQVVPVLLAAVVATVAVVLALLQLAGAHRLERRAETAADAAALAAAEELGRSLRVTVDGIAAPPPSTLRDPAAALARANDARLVELRRAGGSTRWTVSAVVETVEGVTPGPLAGVVGRTARTGAAASVEVAIAPLPPSPAGIDRDRLPAQAGHPLRADSALAAHAGSTCRTGLDTDHLSDAAKVAVVRAEAVLGRPLPLRAGFRSEACLADAGVGLPALSPAPRGDELVVDPTDADAVAALDAAGTCPVGAGLVVDTSPACTGGLAALVTIRTRLVPTP